MYSISALLSLAPRGWEPGDDRAESARGRLNIGASRLTRPPRGERAAEPIAAPFQRPFIS